MFKYFSTLINKTISKIFVYETDAAKMFILSTPTEVYKINTDGTGLLKLCDVSNVIDGVQFEKSFYFVDGSKIS